jgi:uncharacterized protein GlcG (DUF336 family)
MNFYRVTGAAMLAVVFASIGPGLAHGKSGKGGKSAIDSSALETQCASAANAQDSAVRPGKKTKMWCAVVDREGKTLAIEASDTGGTPDNPRDSDAWRGSIEIALAKAYGAVAFSSNDQALPTLTLGLLSRPDGGGVGTVGADAGPAPLWGIGDSNPYRSVGNGNGLGRSDAVGQYHHGIITFAGGEPVYTKPNSTCGGGTLIGAVGVSGDGVDEDDAVAKAAVLNADYCLAP